MTQNIGTVAIKPTKPLILASKSEARDKILQKSGILFSIKPSNVNESEIKKNINEFGLYKIVKQLAIKKASQIGKLYPEAYVIGADQICSLGKKIFDKPKTEYNAIKQLTELSGKTHKQYTAVCLYHKNKMIWSKVEISTLRMHKLTTNEIKNYVKHEKPFNSCGSYKLESLGFNLFSKIDGSDDTIQGLPLLPLLKELKKHGIYSIEKIVSI